MVRRMLTFKGPLTFGGRARTFDLYCAFLSALEQFYADSRLHWAIDLEDTASGWQDKAPISVGRNHLGGIAYKGRLVSVLLFFWFFGGGICGKAIRTMRSSKPLFENLDSYCACWAVSDRS